MKIVAFGILLFFPSLPFSPVMADDRLMRELALESATMWKERAAELKQQVEAERAANEELRKEYNELVDRCRKLREKNRELGGGSGAPKKESKEKRHKADKEDAPKRDRHCSVCKERIAAFSCTKPACVQERERVKAEKELKRAAL